MKEIMWAQRGGKNRGFEKVRYNESEINAGHNMGGNNKMYKNCLLGRLIGVKCQPPSHSQLFLLRPRVENCPADLTKPCLWQVHHFFFFLFSFLYVFSSLLLCFFFLLLSLSQEDKAALSEAEARAGLDTAEGNEAVPPPRTPLG